MSHDERKVVATDRPFRRRSQGGERIRRGCRPIIQCETNARPTASWTDCRKGGLMHYPNMSDPAEFPVVGDEAAQLPQTAVRTLRVDPRHSMKVATAELETALEQLGADMNPASRRQTALLASELIAQVVGRDLDLGNGAVDLTVRF